MFEAETEAEFGLEAMHFGLEDLTSLERSIQ